MTYYLVFLILPVGLGMLAQHWVRRAFDAGSRIQAASGLSGAQVSRLMLDAGGLQGVSVESVGGSLTDHYDPRAKVMRLSVPVGGSSSVSAVAVAAHETGHAFQDGRREFGFRARSALVPATGFASNAWFLVFLVGVFTRSTNLIMVGAVLFAALVAFQLLTLPVEIGASRKALAMLTDRGVISGDQVPVARRVLTAAASTYLVATLLAVMQLVYLLGFARR
ncbi:MAG TPA: zinc metallopeptidase [Gaiellales bacterium]|nr:zinc metallopeptidase [Gaiellales bacterium]